MVNPIAPAENVQVDQLLSPKQVARAIDVSESSLKRWCDQGLLPTIRTAGGHRRLPVSGVLEFIRQGDHKLVRPEILGLPATSGQSVRVVRRAKERMEAALLAGDHLQCRQLMFDLHLAQQSIAAIGDQVLAPAFEAIGAHWECGEAEVYQERRACEIAMRCVLELASTLPVPQEGAHMAMGAAAWGDHYQLPTLLVEMVFRSHGWKGTSLGSRLPADTLRAAIETMKPELFWLSVSHIDSPERFVEEYGRLYDAVGPQTKIVLGGRALTPEIRQQLECAFFCEKLADLEQFLATDCNAPAASTADA